MYIWGLWVVEEKMMAQEPEEEVDKTFTIWCRAHIQSMGAAE